MSNPKIDKWTCWLTGTIANDVLRMYLRRDAWQKVSKIIEDNGRLPDSYWWGFMLETYETTQALAVRRQADTHLKVASLARVIREIECDPAALTREFWVGLFDTNDPLRVQEVDRVWTQKYARDVKVHVDPAIPAADLKALKAAAKSVKQYVNRHVAHADASAVSAAVTVPLNDVDTAIDAIGALFKEYNNLLTPGSYAFLVPTIQEDWTAIFKTPWLRAESTVEFD